MLNLSSFVIEKFVQGFLFVLLVSLIRFKFCFYQSSCSSVNG